MSSPSNNAPPDLTEIPVLAGRPHCARLLYIEDNPVNVLVVEELLATRPQFTLLCEVDGTSGLARALSMQPDLILLDMQLPDFDGYEVIARLRLDPRTANIPCIALSANAMPEDVRRAKLAGFLAYWTKPIDFKAFLQGLDEFFDAKP
ncbi:response regulator [Paucibacter sp. B2R-40]|uniref:response regulator n=1 Tax=Paucibacter sp. B2R-40 TaxID=2893554 RepID=UPI0021E381DA|nr:response regulator [Paucibacter sp. B2R-40]MCV2354097.1 response regulator [Paucibacter sp. B2R-40]